MKRVSLKGILLGLLVMLLIEGVASVIGGVLVAVRLARVGMTQPQSQAALAAMSVTPEVLVPSLLLGLFAMAAGGYVTVRVAKTEPYLNATIIGVVGFALGIPLAGRCPLWFNVTSLLLIIPTTLLGGRLAATRVSGSR